MKQVRHAVQMGIVIALAVIVAITILTICFVLAHLAFHVHPVLGYVVFAGTLLLLVNCILREMKCF